MIRTIPTFTQHGGVHCLSKTGNAVQIASLGRVESWRLSFTGASRGTKTKNPRRIPIARPLLPMLEAMHDETGGVGKVITAPSDASRTFRRGVM